MTDIAITANIQRLILQTAKLNSLSAGTMTNGMYDCFINTLGIDGSSSYYWGHGFVKPAISFGSWSTTWTSPALTTDGTGKEWFSFRQEHDAANISLSGNQVRVTLEAHSASPTTLSHVCFSRHTGLGNGLYDFGSSTFQEFMFSGTPGCSISAGLTAVSDGLYFTLDETLNYMTIMQFAGADGNIRYKTTTADGTWYNSQSPNDWNLTLINGKGYTNTIAGAYIVTKVETGTATEGTFSVISNAVFAPTVTSGASATVFVENIDASTKIYVSSSLAIAWTELTNLTLVCRDILGTGIHQYQTDYVPFIGSADCAMRWKFESAAGYSTACYGIAVNWS